MRGRQACACLWAGAKVLKQFATLLAKETAELLEAIMSKHGKNAHIESLPKPIVLRRYSSIDTRRQPAFEACRHPQI